MPSDNNHFLINKKADAQNTRIGLFGFINHNAVKMFYRTDNNVTVNRKV